MEDSRLEIAFSLLNTKDNEDCSVVGYLSPVTTKRFP